MSRAPDQPARMTRQQRRHIERQLRKLSRRNVCSICGSVFKHNSRTAGGLDAQGNVVLAGECCIGKVAATFTMGFYNARQYDFPFPDGDEPKSTNTKPTSGAGIAEAIALYQNVITESDKFFDDTLRRGGETPIAPRFTLHDAPWKQNDSDWFKQNQQRSHRVRMPFPGEADKEVPVRPAGHALMILVRQVEPGSRIRAAVHVPADLLPLPDDEAAVHALFEAAAGREAMPPDREALNTLIEKYKTQEASQ